MTLKWHYINIFEKINNLSIVKHNLVHLIVIKLEGDHKSKDVDNKMKIQRM
jgi:predicted SprT family Zn-dependent metalloprotease